MMLAVDNWHFLLIEMKTQCAETISLPVSCDVSNTWFLTEYRSTSFLLLSSDSSLQWMLIIGIRWVCVIGSLWLGVERVLPSTCAAVGHTVHNFLDVTTNYLLNPWSTLVSFGETPQQIPPGTCRPGLHAPDHCFKLRVKTGTLAISEKWKLVEIF